MFYLILISPLLVAAVIVFVVATALAATYGRLGRALATRRQAAKGPSASRPDISVIILAHNQCDALRRHLPAVLCQDYEAFEVIVVDVASDDDTLDLLEAMEQEHPHLRHTYTPTSARDISLERLALTLGIRAARGEWIVVTEADCEPASSRWLTTIAEETAEWRTLLVGLARYTDPTPRTMQFTRLWQTILAAGRILDGGSATYSDSANIAFRRQAFLDIGGFGTDHELRSGAVELLANRMSQPRTTALLLSSDAIVLQDAPPSAGEWHRRQVAEVETHHHLRNTLRVRLRQVLLLLQPWLMTLVVGGTAVLSGIVAAFANNGMPLPGWLLTYGRTLPSVPQPDAQSLFVAATVVTGVMTLLLVAYIVVKLVAVGRTTRALGYKSRPFSFLVRELFLPLRNLRLWFAWRRTPRNEFRKKFV